MRNDRTGASCEKGFSAGPADMAAFHLRRVINGHQIHHTQMLTALDALRRLIPEPEDTGAEAVSLLGLISRHVELHSESTAAEIDRLDEVWPAPA